MRTSRDWCWSCPALVGVFWGAPLLARELETGTFRLVWTQSVTRRRWLAVKLGLVGGASVAVAGLLGWVVTWWSVPVDRVNLDRFSSPLIFSERGLVPLGYAAFAFALGVVLGLLLRRTVPAMAATLAVFVGARLAVTQWLRPHLMAPVAGWCRSRRRPAVPGVHDRQAQRSCDRLPRTPTSAATGC